MHTVHASLIIRRLVFAHQGYFTIAINPTGSTTFGQSTSTICDIVEICLIVILLELTDAIRKDWGGKPFVDMQKGWKYVLDKYPEIDQDRAVAAGASWGGYAIKYVYGLRWYDNSLADKASKLDPGPSRVWVWIQGAVLPRRCENRFT